MAIPPLVWTVTNEHSTSPTHPRGTRPFLPEQTMDPLHHSMTNTVYTQALARLPRTWKVHQPWGALRIVRQYQRPASCVPRGECNWCQRSNLSTSVPFITHSSRREVGSISSFGIFTPRPHNQERSDGESAPHSR